MPHNHYQRSPDTKPDHTPEDKVRAWLEWIYVAYQLYSWISAAIRDAKKASPEYGDPRPGLRQVFKEVTKTGRLSIVDDYIDRKGLRMGVERRRCLKHGLRRRR